MRTKKKVIKKISLDVFLSVQDLMPDYGLKPEVEEIMDRVAPEVSLLLRDMLEEQLLGFHEDMQIEMAENLEEFACLHEAHFTGSPDVDYVLTNAMGGLLLSMEFRVYSLQFKVLSL